MSTPSQPRHWLSQRASDVVESATMAMTERAGRLRAQGVDIVSFSAGEPDFDTPEHIKQAAVEALRKGHTKYTPATGTPALKAAIARKFQRDHGLAYDPSQIVVSCGAKHSLYNITQAVLDPGDEVIIPAPFWVSYPSMTTCAGATPVILETSETGGFKVRPEALRRAITPRTKAFILCNPCNPTGTVYTADELRALADVILETGILLVSDEVYEKLCYGVPFVSSAAVDPRMPARTVVVNACSKTYAMTGWRIGYAAGPLDVMAAVGRMQSQSTSNANSMAQNAAIAALDGDQSCVETMRVEYGRRRDFIVGRLRAMPGISCVEPPGAFYVFPNVSALFGKSHRGTRIANSAALAEALLDHAHVALVPGTGFGMEGYVRISYASSMDRIREGMDRLERFVRELA